MTDAPLPETYVADFHDLDAVKRMEYRHVSHFGLVSTVSFGASGLGGMFTAGQGTGLKGAEAGKGADEDIWFQQDDTQDLDQARELVLGVLKAGVNMIDSSHWYGQGRSERMLGYALKGVPRSAYYINTKIGRYDKDPMRMFDFSYEKTYQAGLDSLRRLGLEQIDSLQIHDPEFAPSIEVVVDECIPALQKLKAEGKIRLIGMTGYPLELQQELITKAGPGVVDTSLTYCHYCLSDTSLATSGFIDFCKERGIGLINASPIAMGLLMNRDPPDWHPAKPATKALCREAVKYCKEAGVDISKLALHFTLSNTAIGSTLISSTSASRMASNIAACSETLSREEQQALTHLREKIFAPAGEQTWENVEIGAYWETVGKRLLTQQLYNKKRKAS